MLEVAKCKKWEKLNAVDSVVGPIGQHGVKEPERLGVKSVLQPDRSGSDAAVSPPASQSV